MKLPIIKENVLGAVVICTLIIVVLICSYTAKAQEVAPSYLSHPAKNADKRINFASNINYSAKAVPMNSSICSPYPELKPAFAPHGDKLYFSRVGHPNNTFGEDDLEDIWYCQYDTTTDVWSQPIRMPGFLNNSGPNYIENVSITGDTIILGNQYLKKGKMRAGVSYSVNVNGTWSVPQPILIKNDYNISVHENHFVSLKRGVIISAIQRAETSGDRDLYVSFWNGESASEPVNMGAIINSEMEESSPYLACDNETLYFASKGHNSYGGFDIFVTKRLDDSWTNWSVPQNLGPAVNGPLDEEFFSITHCGRFAIFSKQVSVHNVDLFKVTTAELFGTTMISDLKQSKMPRKTMSTL